MQIILMLLLIRIKCPAIEGVPPKNGGRFIPCRGGGTDTTYYTDAHNVDEDVTAIPYHGGYWPHGDIAGIALRDIACDSSDLFFTVASRLIYLS